MVDMVFNHEMTLAHFSRLTQDATVIAWHHPSARRGRLPALALVNSLRRDRSGVVDDISDTEAFARWLDARLEVRAELGPVDVVDARTSGGDPGRLRRGDRRRTGPPEAVNNMNEVAAAAPGAMTLRPDLTREWQFLGGRPSINCSRSSPATRSP